MSLDILREERRKKMEVLRSRGEEPFAISSHRTHTTVEAVSLFDSLCEEKKEVTLAGRVVSLRAHGGVVFFDLFDGSATGVKLQAMAKKDVTGDDAFQMFVDTVDVGDFVEVTGVLFLTKRNEKTLESKQWRMLSKSLRPLPDKWAGLADEETKLRHRYLDILSDDEIRERFILRAKFWSVMRSFLLERGFLEVETPVLENTAGGADARPFVTHHNALDIDVYLRISAGELWQKRLMVAGYEKTFEIGRIFRNEGIDPEHAQDYTQMECYFAYADYRDCMKLMQEMYRKIAQDVFGTLQFKIRGFDIDLGKAWETIDYRETIKKETDIDIAKTTLAAVNKKLEELGLEFSKDGWNLTRGIDMLMKYCRKKIAGPVFLINPPVAIEPLAKRAADNPDVVERFQIILAGSEMGKGFSELNDPIDQAVRFEEQAKLRAAGDEEAQMNDTEFVEALEYGMPPTAGFGVSERLFSFLLNKPVRECQIFPLLRPEKGREA